jgi:hypothetical protein
VIVSNIIDPLNIQLQLDCYKDELESLMEQLEKFYFGIGSSFYDMPAEYVQHGRLCACFYSVDQSWYRCFIHRVFLDKQVAKIYFIDYGGFETVRFDKIKFLAKGFDELPPCAVRCRLANIKSLNEKWPDNIVTYLLDKTQYPQTRQPKLFQAKIFGINQIYLSVDLYDTNPKNDIFKQLTYYRCNDITKEGVIHLNNMLVKDNLASYYDETREDINVSFIFF